MMRINIAKLRSLFLVVIVSFPGCSGGDSLEKQNQSEESKLQGTSRLVENSSQDLNEVILKIMSFDELQMLIASHLGKIVVLDVWSTTCGPCLKEFPQLVKLHHRYSRDDVICISLSLDYLGISGKPPEAYQKEVLRFLNLFGASFDNILAREESDEMFSKLGIGAPPAVFVYDRRGALAKKFDNSNVLTEEDAFTYKDISRLVEKLIQGIE